MKHFIEAYPSILDANNAIEDLAKKWYPISIADTNRYISVLYRSLPVLTSKKVKK
jgi:hypothetical protein